MEVGMKKISVIVFILSLAACAAFSETTAQSDDVYKDLDQLKQQIRRMKREMTSLIKEVTAEYPDDAKSLTGGWGQDIKIDVTETDKDVLVKADLPGMEKDKIDVTLEQGKILKIAGSRDVMKSQVSQGLVVQERSRGAFARTIELPAECKPDGIKASYNNGVLDIAIAKKAKTKDDTVKVKVQ
jgi:HSP20 family protein